MSPLALVDSRDDLRSTASTATSSDRTMEKATAVMTTLTSPTPVTSTNTALQRLDRFADEAAVDSLLTSFLARRRALRRARQQHAVQQARHEHEMLQQRALLGAGLIHLR